MRGRAAERVRNPHECCIIGGYELRQRRWVLGDQSLKVTLRKVLAALKELRDSRFRNRLGGYPRLRR
jgi:hypothetical protein